MAGAARTLGEIFPQRFILGMGVSGGPFMKRHGLNYQKPLSYMREYLAQTQRLDASEYRLAPLEPRPRQPSEDGPAVGVPAPAAMAEE